MRAWGCFTRACHGPLGLCALGFEAVGFQDLGLGFRVSGFRFRV